MRDPLSFQHKASDETRPRLAKFFRKREGLNMSRPKDNMNT